MPESAEYWQKRADDAKAEADKMHDPECKEIMLDIAKAYERIADFARQGRPDPKPTKPRDGDPRAPRSRSGGPRCSTMSRSVFMAQGVGQTSGEHH
jgi:hypothetical protein